MSTRHEGNMVLRSIYLPEAVDDELRAVAFSHRRSKGDLIREFIAAGLQEMTAPRHRGTHRLAERKAEPQEKASRSRQGIAPADQEA